MPEGGSGVGTALEVSKIVLKLETNFQEVLKRQVVAFDKFTKDTNAITRQVGTNMNQLARTVSQSFSTLFKSNKQEVQEMVSFTRSALQGVRKETLRIQSLQDRYQSQMIERYRNMRSEIGRLQAKAITIKGSGLGEESKASFLKTIQSKILQAKQVYEKEIANLQKLTHQALVKNLANAVNEAMTTIAKGSRTAAVTVNNVVKDMQSRFNQLYSQRKFMSEADFAEAGVGFLKQRASQIKALESLLVNHQRKQEQAEKYLAKQKTLLSQQTNEALAAHQRRMVDQARQTVRKLGTEYEFMFNKIQSFARGQTAITGVFTKQAQNVLTGIKQSLRGLNLKRDFENMWKGLDQVARLAGEKSGQAFFEAVRKGKALDQALIEKKKHLEGLLVQAKMLQSTGLIDARRQIRSLNQVIGSIKEFRAEFAKVKREISQIPNISEQRFAQGGINQARNLANSVRLAIGTLKNMGKVTEDNIINVQISLRKIESLYKQHENKVAQSYRTLAVLEKEMGRAKTMAAQASNEQSIKAWENYYRRVVAIHTRLADQLKRSVLPANPLKEMELQTIQTINRIRKEAAAKLVPVAEIKAQADSAKREFEELGRKMQILGLRKFVKPEQIAEGEAFIKRMRSRVEEYNKSIRDLGVQLERLRRLQKAGLGDEGMANQIAVTRDRMVMLQQQVRQYERMQVGMEKRISAARKQSLKESATSMWEMIRNFRWQVASIIYLATRAVWFVNRTIIKVLDEINEYRKSAMSIAAAIAFQMSGSIEQAFDKAYSYSRKLMTQLELVASETILSLEDMLMLTKTFAQAGIIPKGEEDVRKIATIGAAIKALTEGMANAGVQMRQELYAVIQGRQRATDQLAKMFQVMGINITELIDNAKKEGKSMIDVLEDALKPFSEMNKRMVDEWGQIKNRIDIVWKLIKRLGGETFLVNFSKELNRMLDTFVTKSKDGFQILTARGAHLSAWINVALNIFKSLWDIVKGVAETIGSIVNMIGSIAKSIYTIGAALAQSQKGLERMKGEWDGIFLLLEIIVQSMNALAQIILLIANFVKSVAIVLELWVERFRAVLEMMKAAKEFRFGDALDIYGGMVKKGKEANDELRDIWTGPGGWYATMRKSIDAIKDQFKELSDKARGIYPKTDVDIDVLKPPHDVMKMAEKAGRLVTAMNQTILQGLEGPEKFAEDRRQALKEYAEYNKELQENVNWYATHIKMAVEGKLKVDPTKLTHWVNVYKGQLKDLADTNTYIAAVMKKEQKELADWNEQQARKMAGYQREYETFWESLVPKDLTRAEKTKKWFAEMNAKLDEMHVKNPLVAKDFEKFKKALEEALGQRRLDDIAAIQDEYEQFVAQLTSHRPVDEISKIGAEFERIRLKIKDNIDLSPQLRLELEKLFDITKKERIEVETLNLSYRASAAELELMSKRAEYMAQSYSPIKRMQGDIEQLKIDYKKSMMEIQKEIDITYQTWVKDGKWATTQGATEAKRYVESLQLQMEELTKATQREIQKKQMPIWNDIVEASNNWAEGFTDSLSQIVDGVDSVSEALNQLQTQILKDTLKIIIKRTITDRLQDMLGSGFTGDQTPFQKWFGGGKKTEIGKGAQEITASKPIPVTVWNTKDLMGETAKALEPKIAIPEDAMGVRVFVTNWPVGGMEGIVAGGIGEVTKTGVEEVSRDLADASKEIADNTAKASQESKSWYDGIKETFSGIGEWFSGIFSKIGGWFGGGGTDWTSAAMQAGSMFMQHGGIIKEPIVGRGLESGTTYNFGERAKYGENELVAPMKKFQQATSQNKFVYQMPIHISSIDTQSGVEFLMKHSDTIQAQMVRNLKKNKPLRKGIQNAY